MCAAMPLHSAKTLIHRRESNILLASAVSAPLRVDSYTILPVVETMPVVGMWLVWSLALALDGNDTILPLPGLLLGEVDSVGRRTGTVAVWFRRSRLPSFALLGGQYCGVFCMLPHTKGTFRQHLVSLVPSRMWTF